MKDGFASVHERVVMARMMRALRSTVLYRAGLSEYELERYYQALGLVLPILALMAMFLVASVASADTIPENKAVLAIIGEAENQGSQGMLAVAYWRK